jgi:hypothetical protein
MTESFRTPAQADEGVKGLKGAKSAKGWTPLWPFRLVTYHLSLVTSEEPAGIAQLAHLNFKLNTANRQLVFSLVAFAACLLTVSGLSLITCPLSPPPPPDGGLGPVKGAIFVPGGSFYGPVPYNG